MKWKTKNLVQVGSTKFGGWFWISTYCFVLRIGTYVSNCERSDKAMTTDSVSIRVDSYDA